MGASLAPRPLTEASVVSHQWLMGFLFFGSLIVIFTRVLFEIVQIAVTVLMSTQQMCNVSITACRYFIDISLRE